MTLVPGAIIVTGAPTGVGMARTPTQWMKEGEIDSERIGDLRNIIVAEV